MFISMVIPVYNAEKHIARCIKSLLDQTYENFEVIIVDDGSTDRSVEIIRDLVGKDSRFLILCKENGGKHTATNYAMKFTKGQYIIVLDSDDYLYQNSLYLIVSNIGQNPINIFLHAKSQLEIFSKNRYILKDFCSLNADVIFCVDATLLKNTLFPEYDSENFVTEAVVWNKILDSSPAIAHSIVVVDGEYLSTGLSAKYFELLKNNPQGVLELVKINYAVKNNSFVLIKQSASHYVAIMNAQYNRQLLKLVGIRYTILIISLATILKIKRKFTLIKIR